MNANPEELRALCEAQQRQAAHALANPYRVTVPGTTLIRRNGRKLLLNLKMDIDGQLAGPINYLEFWISPKCAVEVPGGYSIPLWQIMAPLKRQALGELHATLPVLSEGKESYKSFTIKAF